MTQPCRKQEAQLPQRNSASAAHVYLQHRLANWSCNAQNTAASQRLYYFWHSNALIQEVLAEKRYGKQYYMTICYPLSTGKWLQN